MKKILLILAACFLSSVALAQPMPERHGPGQRYDRPSHRPQHRPQKVWVPAHRENGRWVRGHYTWRR